VIVHAALGAHDQATTVTFIHSCVDDDVLNEDWIKNRMVRSHRLLSLVLVAIGFGRRISKRNKMKRGQLGGDGIELCGEQKAKSQAAR
jgi:hypothetical protein